LCKTCYFGAALQLTSAALERDLQGKGEKLRSGENGRIREAIQQVIARMMAGVDGSRTIQAKLEELLGTGGTATWRGEPLANDVPPRLDGWKRGRLGSRSRRPIAHLVTLGIGDAAE